MLLCDVPKVCTYLFFCFFGHIFCCVLTVLAGSVTKKKNECAGLRRTFLMGVMAMRGGEGEDVGLDE